MPCPWEVFTTTVHPCSPGDEESVMAIPAMIFPALASRGGEDFGGVAAGDAFVVEDWAWEEPLAEGGGRPAQKRRIQE